MQTHFLEKRLFYFIRPNNCKQAIFFKDILGKLCFEWFPRVAGLAVDISKLVGLRPGRLREGLE
jgi:hypothetical protein